MSLQLYNFPNDQEKEVDFNPLTLNSASLPSRFSPNVVDWIQVALANLNDLEDYQSLINGLRELNSAGKAASAEMLAKHLERVLQLHTELDNLMIDSGIPPCKTNQEAAYARQTKKILDQLPDLLKEAARKGEPHVYINGSNSNKPETDNNGTLWTYGFRPVVTPQPDKTRFYFWKIPQPPLIENCVDSKRMTRDHCTNVPAQMIWDFCKAHGIEFTSKHTDDYNVYPNFFCFKVPTITHKQSE